MRELTMSEIGMVTGGGGTCTSDEGNNLAGIGDSESFGDYLINIYDGLVAATSYIIEQVAESF